MTKPFSVTLILSAAAGAFTIGDFGSRRGAGGEAATDCALASILSGFCRARASSSLTSLSCLCSSSDCFCSSSVCRSSFWIFSASDSDCAGAVPGIKRHAPTRALHAIKFCRVRLQSTTASPTVTSRADTLVRDARSRQPNINRAIDVSSDCARGVAQGHQRERSEPVSTWFGQSQVAQGKSFVLTSSGGDYYVTILPPSNSGANSVTISTLAAPLVSAMPHHDAAPIGLELKRQIASRGNASAPAPLRPHAWHVPQFARNEEIRHSRGR